MKRIEGKIGEKVLITASYSCAEHADSWFSFYKNDTFKLCPRCRNEQKTGNTWYSHIPDEDEHQSWHLHTLLSVLLRPFHRPHRFNTPPMIFPHQKNVTL